jgi:hypothetical protein
MAQPSLEKRASLETRVAVLEQQMILLKQSVVPAKEPWWRRVTGILTDDATLDEAMRLGREYRESLRPGGKRQKGRVKKHGHTRYRSGDSAGSKR